MTDPAPAVSIWRGKTIWARDRAAPLRAFLQTESGSAGVLVAAIAAALIWANINDSSYESVWDTVLSLRLGSVGITHDIRAWINSGLMTLFFLVVGLEARREFDLGDLRERRRFILPCLAGLVGMAVPVAAFLVINAGRSSMHGWGVAMSTDTALALGLLAILGRNVPDRVRAFLLTVFVVDDLAALAVIAIVYSKHIEIVPLCIAIAVFALLLVATALRMRQRSVYAGLGIIIWAALLASGVDPVVTGLAIGLSATAYSPTRGELEEATGLVRLFREQPTPELARTATVGLTATLSPNARLQLFYHPWTSYVIVPLFALANAGIVLNSSFLSHAYTAPITLGVLVGYVVGKPIAIVGTAYAVTWLSRGRIRPPVGWAAVLGSGTIAGIGFTVALLIADRAFSGAELDQAKLGALSAAVVASLLTWTVYRLTALLPKPRRARALLGDARLIQDLIPAVDPDGDHIRGPAGASITVIEFGDFECPYCGRAEPVVRDLLDDADVRYVWRHLPLSDVHPQAQLAAEAAEAAAAQDAFWPMHDLLLAHQDQLRFADLLRYAEELGLDTARFTDELKRHVHETRVAQDVESADLSGVSGTPTFFINGQRHYGAFDIDTLKRAVKTARAQAVTASSRRRTDLTAG
jgi:Na+/H+ antiporter NhaA